MVWQLITIPFSHFCEKARWALDWAGLPYEERAYLPGLHLTATALRRRGRSVPVLLADGACYPDSTLIMQLVDARRPAAWPSLYGPSAKAQERTLALEEELDGTLGPAARVIAYHYLLASLDDLLRVVGPAFSPRGQWWLRRLMPRVGPKIKAAYRVDAQGVAKALQTVDTVFSRMDKALAQAAYVAGDDFSAADLTLAALATPILLWSEMPYLFDRDAPRQDGVAALPAGYRDLVLSLRQRPTGQHCRRLYATKRGRAGSGEAAVRWDGRADKSG